jgi:hypothetical protein
MFGLYVYGGSSSSLIVTTRDSVPSMRSIVPTSGRMETDPLDFTDIYAFFDNQVYNFGACTVISDFESMVRSCHLFRRNGVLATTPSHPQARRLRFRDAIGRFDWHGCQRYKCSIKLTKEPHSLRGRVMWFTRLCDHGRPRFTPTTAWRPWKRRR